MVSVIFTALALGSVAVQAQTYVGSFVVEDGPDWQTNPPVYTGQEAAALLFGGSASDYAISTDSNTSDAGTITNTAWYDGWGEDCTEFDEDFSVDVAPAGYELPSGSGNSWSAYVDDHSCTEVNYVWRIADVPPVATTAVPTMGTWALMMLSGLAALVGLRRFKANA